MTAHPTTVHFRTAAGSRVTISGAHHGIHDILFDWFAEGACCEARPAVDTLGIRVGEVWLHWQCDCCGDGGAPLVECGARCDN